MSRDNARSFLLDMLDRVAAIDGPLWEADPDDRGALVALLATPTTAVSVLHDDDGELRVEGAADLFLGTAILSEIALQFAREGAPGRSREEAVSMLRQRLLALLG